MSFDKRRASCLEVSMMSCCSTFSVPTNSSPRISSDIVIEGSGVRNYCGAFTRDLRDEVRLHFVDLFEMGDVCEQDEHSRQLRRGLFVLVSIGYNSRNPN